MKQKDSAKIAFGFEDLNSQSLVFIAGPLVMHIDLEYVSLPRERALTVVMWKTGSIVSL
jgi:hypothetical protein